MCKWKRWRVSESNKCRGTFIVWHWQLVWYWEVRATETADKKEGGSHREIERSEKANRTFSFSLSLSLSPRVCVFKMKPLLLFLNLWSCLHALLSCFRLSLIFYPNIYSALVTRPPRDHMFIGCTWTQRGGVWRERQINSQHFFSNPQSDFIRTTETPWISPLCVFAVMFTEEVMKRLHK